MPEETPSRFVTRAGFEIPEIILRVTITGVLVVGALITILVFLRLPAWRNEITFAAAVVGGAAAIYSAYYAGIALRINVRRDRQKRAYEILDSFNQIATVKARVTIDHLARAGSSGLPYQRIVQDLETEVSVRHLLGVLDDIAIVIKTGYADEKVLFWSLRHIAQVYYDRLRQYIDGLREGVRQICGSPGSNRLSAPPRTPPSGR